MVQHSSNQKSMNLNCSTILNFITSTTAEEVIPPAAHARKHTLSESKVEYYKVAESIYEAMSKGHTSVCLKATLSAQCLAQLLKLGYDVSTDHDERTYAFTYISWKE